MIGNASLFLYEVVYTMVYTSLTECVVYRNIIFLSDTVAPVLALYKIRVSPGLFNEKYGGSSCKSYSNSCRLDGAYYYLNLRPVLEHVNGSLLLYEILPACYHNRIRKCRFNTVYDRM